MDSNWMGEGSVSIFHLLVIPFSLRADVVYGGNYKLVPAEIRAVKLKIFPTHSHLHIYIMYTYVHSSGMYV